MQRQEGRWQASGTEGQRDKGMEMRGEVGEMELEPWGGLVG